jgi:hypothetical protein
MTGPDTIVARNIDGAEVELTVVDRAGLIVIPLTPMDDELIMSPVAALDLAHQIIELVIKHRRGSTAGPLSGSF